MITLKRKQAERKDRKSAILNAARSLLLKKGYDAVSIRQIAEICELGAGTIYSYFSSKAEIYATLSTEVFDLLHEQFKIASAAVNSPADRLHAIGSSLLKFSTQHRAFYDLLDYFISSPRTIFPVETKSRVDEYAMKVLDPIIDAIEEGAVTGIFHRVDSKQYALLFLGTMHGVLHLRKLRDTMLAETGFDGLYHQSIESMICSLRIPH